MPSARRRHVRHVNGRPMDYTSPADMREARAVQQQRRGGADDQWVVGAMVLHAGGVSLLCVEQAVTYNLTGALTLDARRFARWRTKQAAWAWLKRHPVIDARVIHLGRLDVLTAETVVVAGSVDSESTDQVASLFDDVR